MGEIFFVEFAGSLANWGNMLAEFTGGLLGKVWELFWGNLQALLANAERNTGDIYRSYHWCYLYSWVDRCHIITGTLILTGTPVIGIHAC